MLCRNNDGGRFEAGLGPLRTGDVFIASWSNMVVKWIKE